MVRKQAIGVFYIVAADLTNMRTILRGGNQTSMYFDMEPVDMATYVGAREYLGPAVAMQPVAEAAAVVLQQLQAEGIEVGEQPAFPHQVANPGLDELLDQFAEGAGDVPVNVVDGDGMIQVQGLQQMFGELAIGGHVVQAPDGQLIVAYPV